MTEVVAIDPVVSEPESPIAGAVEYPIHKLVNLAQLEDELRAALDSKQQLVTALTGPDRPLEIPSESNPMSLWLKPASASAAVVQKVLDEHQPQNNYGTPKVLTDFDAVFAKVLENPEANLTAKEQKALLIGLTVKWHQQSIVSVPVHLQP